MTTQITTNCRICGCEIVQDAIDYDILKAFSPETRKSLVSFAKATICPDCESKADQEYQRMRIAQGQAGKLAELEELYGMPPLYKQTDINHKDFPQERYNTIRNKLLASLSDQIYLFGDSGKCKTRIAWLLVKAMYITHSYAPRFEICGSLSSSLSTAWSGDRYDENYKQLVNRLSLADFLVIDDLGKERFTDRFCELLFTVTERRISNNMPTLITSNHSAKHISELWTDEANGKAFYRRLREFFTRYDLNK